MIFPYNIYNLSPQTQPFSPKISILAEATAPPPAQWSRQDGVGDGFGDGDGERKMLRFSGKVGSAGLFFFLCVSVHDIFGHG